MTAVNAVKQEERLAGGLSVEVIDTSSLGSECCAAGPSRPRPVVFCTPMCA